MTDGKLSLVVDTVCVELPVTIVRAVDDVGENVADMVDSSVVVGSTSETFELDTSLGVPVGSSEASHGNRVRVV